jgi:hypothetical protein
MTLSASTERDSELAEAIEWRDRYQRTAHINARDADTATAKLAEQSAALDVYKTAMELAHQLVHDAPELNLGNYTDEVVCRLNDAMLQTHRVLSDALAQIEALAGGKTGIGLVDGKVTRFKMPDMGGPDLNEEGDK